MKKMSNYSFGRILTIVATASAVALIQGTHTVFAFVALVSLTTVVSAVILMEVFERMPLIADRKADRLREAHRIDLEGALAAPFVRAHDGLVQPRHRSASRAERRVMGIRGGGAARRTSDSRWTRRTVDAPTDASGRDSARASAQRASREHHTITVSRRYDMGTVSMVLMTVVVGIIGGSIGVALGTWTTRREKAERLAIFAEGLNCPRRSREPLDTWSDRIVKTRRELNEAEHAYMAAAEREGTVERVGERGWHYMLDATHPVAIRLAKARGEPAIKARRGVVAVELF